MTGATHMLAAAAVYNTVRNKPAALVLAFSSHFLLDAVKHFEVSLTWNLFLVLLTGLFLFRTTLYQKDYFLLAAAITGIIPDLNWILDLSPGLSEIHRYFHFVKITYVPVYFLFLEFFLAAFLVCLILKGHALTHPAAYLLSTKRQIKKHK